MSQCVLRNCKFALSQLQKLRECKFALSQNAVARARVQICTFAKRSGACESANLHFRKCVNFLQHRLRSLSVSSSLSLSLPLSLSLLGAIAATRRSTRCVNSAALSHTIVVSIVTVPNVRRFRPRWKAPTLSLRCDDSDSVGKLRPSVCAATSLVASALQTCVTTAGAQSTIRWRRDEPHRRRAPDMCDQPIGDIVQDGLASPPRCPDESIHHAFECSIGVQVQHVRG
jgi:hypothetical protein